jgi:hypothetical protein
VEKKLSAEPKLSERAEQAGKIDTRKYNEQLKKRAEKSFTGVRACVGDALRATLFHAFLSESAFQDE